MVANGEAGPLAAHLDDARGGVEYCLHGRSAKRHDDPGRNQFDLPVQEGQAQGHFLRRRCAIARRPPWHRIGDIDLGSIQPDRRQHTVQQLSRFANKWLALTILFSPRRFADQHDVGVRIAIGKHELRGPQFEPAAIITAQNGLKLTKCLGRCRQTAGFGRIPAKDRRLGRTLNRS